MTGVDGLQFRLFGPFEVRRCGELIASGGGKRRAVLAVLLLSPNTAVSAGRIRDLIWGEQAPPSAFNLIQGYVSDWRSLLTPGRAARASGGRLLSTSTGYRLDVDTDECDLLRFAALADAGGSAALDDPRKARTLLNDALQLRRGPALMDFVADCLEPAAAGSRQSATKSISAGPRRSFTASLSSVRALRGSSAAARAPASASAPKRSTSHSSASTRSR